MGISLPVALPDRLFSEECETFLTTFHSSCSCHKPSSCEKGNEPGSLLSSYSSPTEKKEINKF